jgi:hypothetical protein
MSTDQLAIRQAGPLARVRAFVQALECDNTRVTVRVFPGIAASYLFASAVSALAHGQLASFPDGRR